MTRKRAPTAMNETMRATVPARERSTVKSFKTTAARRQAEAIQVSRRPWRVESSMVAMASTVQAMESAAWATTGICAGLIAILAVGFYLAAPQIFTVFSSDGEVVAEGTGYLRIIALCEVGLVLEIVLEGAFAGAGNSLPPMIIGVPLTAARIPAALVLSGRLGLGVRGVWWAISLSTALKGAVTAAWFRLGRWKETEV